MLGKTLPQMLGGTLASDQLACTNGALPAVSPYRLVRLAEDGNI